MNATRTNALCEAMSGDVPAIGLEVDVRAERSQLVTGLQDESFHLGIRVDAFAT